MPFTITWMDLKGIMLTKCQVEKLKYKYINTYWACNQHYCIVYFNFIKKVNPKLFHYKEKYFLHLVLFWVLPESESEVTLSCPTLWDPMDSSLPGFSIHGIFQARVLEWAAISFSRGSSWLRDRTLVSCIADRCFTVWATREAWVLLTKPWCKLHHLPSFSWLFLTFDLNLCTWYASRKCQ